MRYISVNEYLMGRAILTDLSDELIRNVNTIVPRINELFDAFGQGRAVTSGIRMMTDHRRIYAEKNAARAKQGLSPLAVPLASKHLTCQACDLEDANGEFKAWLKTIDGLKAMARIGLWQEHPDSTPTWVHLQCVAPKSGNRVFIP